MNIPPAGSPYGEAPIWTGRAPSAPPSAPADRLESSRFCEAAPTRPSFANQPPSALEASPRPWPPSSEQLPRGSALSRLAQHPQPQLAASALPGQLALGPSLEQLVAEKEPANARATPDGWRIPRNPSRTPVRERDLFEVPPVSPELGPLRIVASCWGQIQSLRLQWPEEFLEPACSAHQALFVDVLTRMSPDLVVQVVAEGRSEPHLRELLEKWSVPRPERVHIHSLPLPHRLDVLCEPLTLWARDGSVLTQTGEGREVLLLPRSFRGDGQVDPGLNRLVVQATGAAPAFLGQVLPDFLVRRSALSFEGGDVVASRRCVLLGGHSLAKTMASLRVTRQAALEKFQEQFGLPIVVIEPQPEFHIDLGFTFLDEDTVAVADPGMTMGLVGELPELQGQVRVTQEKGLAAAYDRAAEALQRLGFGIIRLPNLAGLGLSTPYITYNNVLIERFENCQRVYLPTYGLPGLDQLAREIYQRRGFEVIEMPSARLTTRLWGALRCATGELAVRGQFRGAN